MKKLQEKGYTLIEVTIALVVTGVLIFSILNFTVNTLVQYAETEVRSRMLSEAQIALDIANNDIRLSASADDSNRWPDDNAPNNEFGWQSDSDTLVLATAAEDNDGNILFADPSEYISHKNNIVYYISSGSLYKRVIAAPAAGNSATTTCPPAEATESCPADKELMQDVETFVVKYIDGIGNEVSPTNARSIELSVELYTERFSRPISVNYTTGMVFRND
jgi:prepilin-type N-terminal cleavage/methylation domain-containing protein